MSTALSGPYLTISIDAENVAVVGSVLCNSVISVSVGCRQVLQHLCQSVVKIAWFGVGLCKLLLLHHLTHKVMSVTSCVRLVLQCFAEQRICNQIAQPRLCISGQYKCMLHQTDETDCVIQVNRSCLSVRFAYFFCVFQCAVFVIWPRFMHKLCHPVLFQRCA